MSEVNSFGETDAIIAGNALSNLTANLARAEQMFQDAYVRGEGQAAVASLRMWFLAVCRFPGVSDNLLDEAIQWINRAEEAMSQPSNPNNFYQGPVNPNNSNVFILAFKAAIRLARVEREIGLYISDSSAKSNEKLKV